MNLLFLFAKVALVGFFLLMFLRSNKLIWGIGLLTVTSAILLDAFLNTFGREEMIRQFGFFYFVIAGALFAGATLWLWGVLRSYTRTENQVSGSIDQLASQPAGEDALLAKGEATRPPIDGIVDPAMYETMRDNFSKDDILDLEFDMGYAEYSDSIPSRNNDEIALAIIDTAMGNNQVEDLTLAIERIQSPLAADHLPRIDKINVDSPRTVFRQYMVANCTMSDVELITSNLSGDSKTVPGDTINAKVRNLLLLVYRDRRGEDLLELLR